MEPTFPDKQLEALYKLIGQETYLEDLMRSLTFFVRDLRPPRVGALQAGCSDESEKECCDVFQRRFVEHFLPQLKFASAFPLRTANLGGRYEWGSVGMAESHFASLAEGDPYTFILVKLNSHVSVVRGASGPSYGKMARYNEESYFCGALHELLEGRNHPFTEELREAFHSEGKSRIETLLDPQKVDPALKNLFVAIVNARLQARKCIIDIQDQPGPMPVAYLVLPCVTFNRSGRDTEMVCGVYAVDRRVHPAAVTYCGLSAEAESYRVEYRADRVRVSSPESLTPRQARDHRQLIKQTIGEQPEHFKHHLRLNQIRSEAHLSKSRFQPYAGVLLKALLGVLLEVSPLPALLLLFGEGLVDIHHIFRLHQLSRHDDPDEEARKILADFHQTVDGLPSKRARHVVELLLEEYGLGLEGENKQPSSNVSRAPRSR